MRLVSHPSASCCGERSVAGRSTAKPAHPRPGVFEMPVPGMAFALIAAAVRWQEGWYTLPRRRRNGIMPVCGPVAQR